MNVPSHDDMLGSIDAFQKRHSEIGDARFGREATGEPGLVARLRAGSSPTLKLLERLQGYMAAKDATLVHAAEILIEDASLSSGNTTQVSDQVSA